MGHVLTGDQLRTALKRLGDIERQLGQKEYPHDPERLLNALQAVGEGMFGANGGYEPTVSQKRVREVMDNTFFAIINDEDVPPQFATTVAKWRKLASDLGYDGPVAWRVKAGFTLKRHAPAAGPCCQKWAYLQDWKLRHDEPTTDSLVFFIPRLVGTSENAKEQTETLVKLRKQYKLPENHMASFGSAALLAGLILANFKRKGERAPLNHCWARTDAFYVDGNRLYLGYFDGTGLYCDNFCYWDDFRVDGIGVFPLGVETLGQ